MIRAALATVLLVAIAASQPAMSKDGLASLVWDYRPLLLFTPTDDDTRLSRQTTILADAQKGITERRLAVYLVERARIYTAFGRPAPGATAKGLRRRFNVPDDQFVLILIGLDGTEKLRRSEPISADDLFAVIDRMPMRQRELDERTP